jgi:hypothetical protein
MAMSENGSFTRCALVSFPKTSPLQTAQGKFVVALNHHYSLKTENETPKKAWKARTTMRHSPR